MLPGQPQCYVHCPSVLHLFQIPTWESTRQTKELKLLEEAESAQLPEEHKKRTKKYHSATEKLAQVHQHKNIILSSFHEQFSIFRQKT